MANDVTLKVGVDSTDAEKGFQEVVEKATDAAQQAQSKFSDVFKGSFAGGFAADFAGDVKNVLQQGVVAAVEAGANFETALQSVSAITGATGEGLNDLGTRAQDLALKFGGSATTQVEMFGTVLSKFGADLAKTPEALGTVAESVNILGKAAGLDAKASVDALSASMLQFGVDASDPAKLASESGRFINVLAASAKVGAAEIPQVSEAILQAGVAAKGAGLSFEETNAAIQGLAVGGKVGSEAGVALRNVIGKLIDGGGEQKKVLESVGLSYEKLGNTLTTSAEDGGGLASALEMLKGGLDKITNPAEKAAAAGKLFGAENASAAGILLDQVDNIKLFTEGVTGTTEAVTQAAINQDTLAQRLDKVKAVIEVGLIKAFQALTPIVKFVFDNFATIATYLSPIAIGLAAVGVAAYVASPAFGALSLGIGSATTATIAWTAALLVNPVFLIASGVALAAIGIVALADAMSTSTEENLENAESQKVVIEEQMKLNKEQQMGEIQTQKLVNEFQQLASKSELSAKEQKRLQEIQSELDRKYPKLIDQTKSYKENLNGVAEIGKATTTELGRLKNENDKLEAAFSKTARLIAYEKRNLAIQTLSSEAKIDVTDFANKLYNAKNEKEVQDAQSAFLERLNKSGVDNITATSTAATQAVNAALATFRKKAEAPIETKVKPVVDPVVDPDKDKPKPTKPPKQDDPRLQAIQDVIQAEKAYQEKALETQQKIADATTAGELTAEQKKLLYQDELARLQKILTAKEGLAEYDGKQFKSIQDIAAITISADGKVISGLQGKKGEIEKVRKDAAKFYDEIDDQINKLNTSLAKLSATENKEVFKTTLEDLKKTSESLRKTTDEKLTTKFAFSVDDKVFSDSIAKLKADFANANNELNAIKVNGDEKQKEDIEKILKENLEKQKTIETDAANIRERVLIERQTDANKRKLDLTLLDLRIQYDKERGENAGNFTKLEELETAYLLEKQRLNDEYNRQNNIEFGIQSAVMTNLMQQFNISRLMEEREANKQLRDEKKASLDAEESDLEKSLADRTITFEEYQQKLSELNQARIDAGLIQENLGDQLLKDLKIGSEKAIAQILTDQGNKLTTIQQDRVNKQVALDAKSADAKKAFDNLQNKVGTEEYIKAQKAYEKAQQDAADNDEMVYGFRESVLEEFGAKAAIQFAQLAASGTANLADFGKATVQLAFEALQKMIPVYIANIAGAEFAKGIGGIATTAILTAALYGLFAAAQSAAGFKDGVVELEGAGTETSDSIPAWLSRGESVITAKATKQNKDELEWMNKTGLPLREFYRHQISQTSVNESGDIIHELRQLRVTTESLGVQINRNTHVRVDGTLQADGNSITAMIESNRKRNSRRF
jgi:TP901 family phage tail tape measure protein